MKIHYGLDFGTTNTSISIVKNGKVVTLPIDRKAPDPRVTRSMLYFLRREMVLASTVSEGRLRDNIFFANEIDYKGEQKYLIGTEAVSQYLSENKNRSAGIRRTIYTGDFTSLGGGDDMAIYYEEIDYGTGRLVQGLKTGLKAKYYKGTKVFGEFYSLEKLISTFVKEIKDRADAEIGENVKNVLVGRPVYFSDDPEKDKLAQGRLEEALRLAGFEDVRFEFEPVAAAKQYLRHSRESGNLLDEKNWIPGQARNDNYNILVFDFGGGTLDTAIVNTATEKVLATDGIYIGGDLLNSDILRAKLWNYFGASSKWGSSQMDMPTHIYEALESWFSIPNLNNPNTMSMLRKLYFKNSDPQALDRLIYLIKANLGFELYEAIEVAKKELSTKEESVIVFQDGIIDINEKITKTEFEEIIGPRVEEIRRVVLRTLDKVDLKPEDIDIVVRTGGSSLIPVFEAMLADIFGKEKITQFETFTSISAGLAL